LTVVTEPEPPQLDDETDAAPAAPAVSPAIFLDRTVNPTLPSAADLDER
jgi:hypothetical protein